MFSIPFSTIHNGDVSLSFIRSFIYLCVQWYVAAIIIALLLLLLLLYCGYGYTQLESSYCHNIQQAWHWLTKYTINFSYDSSHKQDRRIIFFPSAFSNNHEFRCEFIRSLWINDKFYGNNLKYLLFIVGVSGARL